MTSLAMKWRYEQEEAWEREQLRLAYMRGPVPKNDPRLLERVRCRVLIPFYVSGKVVEEGQTVELQRHDAESMAALKRVRIL